MSCIRSVAVHEFGHALGFAHEQNRPDAACESQPQGGNGDEMVGIADISSVMNYCNPSWNNGGKLSNTDVAGLRQFYGSPPNQLVPPPGGSYRQTCNDVTADSTRVYATCRARDGHEWRTALSNWSACPGGLTNSDGRLSCGARPLPEGSYRLSCRDTAVDGDFLAATCRTKHGSWNRTQLAQISACTSPISNMDGALQCAKNNPPAGSYAQTCRDLNVSGGSLFANCRRRDGSWTNTYLKTYHGCNGDISNQDGQLRCANGLALPSGSYAKSCNETFNNSGDLSASCRHKNGSWSWTQLANFSSCGKDIGNIDGSLKCQ